MSASVFGGAGFANLTAAMNVDITQQWGATELTKSASANVRSAWQQIGTVGAAGCSAILLRLTHLNNSGSEHGSQWDIGIGPSGSQVVLLGNINMAQVFGTPQTNLNMFRRIVPVALPPGTIIWMRAAVDVASSTPHLTCTVTPICSQFGEWGEFAGIDAIGSTGTGVGTALTGGASVKGSWVSLGTAARNYAGLMFTVDYAGNSVAFHHQMDVGAGGSGSQVVIVPDLVFFPNADMCGVDFGLLPVQIAAGTQLWARTADLDGGTTLIGLTLYGVWQ